jgi:hypothetical protein
MGLDGRGWKKSVGGDGGVEIRNDLDGFIAVCNGEVLSYLGFWVENCRIFKGVKRSLTLKEETVPTGDIE